MNKRLVDMLIEKVGIDADKQKLEKLIALVVTECANQLEGSDSDWILEHFDMSGTDVSLIRKEFQM